MALPPLTPAQIDWQNETPCARQFGDIYFSSDDGIAESQYVFIDGNRLNERWQTRGHFTIGETGFGSGLNFLLSVERWLAHSHPSDRLHYISVEKHPLKPADLQRATSHWPDLSPISQALREQYPPLVGGHHRLSLFGGRIQLDLLFGDAEHCFNELHCPNGIDAWFLDGFAPSKNPDMWHHKLFRSIAHLSHPGTTLATFTAAGDVRRGLMKAGWQMSKRPGFGKKREMLCGQLAEVAQTNTPNAPWFVTPKPLNKDKRAIVIGAGLAGCSSAHALAKQGWQVTLLEREERIAAGASGNLAGVVMPRLTADMREDGLFYLVAFMHSLRTLKRLKQQYPALDWHPCGVRQQATQQQLTKLRDLALPTDILQMEATELLFPNAGWLSPPQLCQTLLDDAGAAIDLQPQRDVITLDHNGEQWQVNNEARAPIVILANGYDAARLFPGHALQLHKVRGQLAYLNSTPTSQALTQPLCFGGYVLPAYQGIHVTGATYAHDSDNRSIDCKEASQLKSQLIAQLPQFADNDICGGRVAFRTSTPDRLPTIGGMPDLDFFCQRYGDLHHGKPVHHYPAAQHLPGLYINSGHGSRGLTTCLLAADILAAMINSASAPVSRSLLNALNPARFLIRNLKRGQAL